MGTIVELLRRNIEHVFPSNFFEDFPAIIEAEFTMVAPSVFLFEHDEEEAVASTKHHHHHMPHLRRSHSKTGLAKGGALRLEPGQAELRNALASLEHVASTHIRISKTRKLQMKGVLHGLPALISLKCKARASLSPSKRLANAIGGRRSFKLAKKQTKMERVTSSSAHDDGTASAAMAAEEVKLTVDAEATRKRKGSKTNWGTSRNPGETAGQTEPSLAVRPRSPKGSKEEMAMEKGTHAETEVVLHTSDPMNISSETHRRSSLCAHILTDFSMSPQGSGNSSYSP